MTHPTQTVDPVSRDLNRYLVEQEQHDIRREHIQATAEQEFNQLGYREIIEYQDDLHELETLFEGVESNNLSKAKAALNAFIQGVKDAYLENRTRELEQEEETERVNDERIDLYFMSTESWC